MRRVLLVGSLVIGLLLNCGLLMADDKKIKIGLALPTQQEERWVLDMKAMETDAKAAGVELLVQIARNDQMQQNNQVDQLLAQGINVLILAAHDGAGAAAAVNKAREEGVKVISYDRLILNCDLDLYISFDNVKVGELQGEYISKLVPQGNYIIMSGAPTDNNAKLFKEGAMKVLQPLIDAGKIKVVVDQPVIDWQPANAQKIVENALTKADNKVDAILAPNDGTASGAIAALQAQGLAGKVPITGQDAEVAAAKRIMVGTQTMTIFKDTRILAKKALLMAIKMANNEPYQDEINGKVNNNKIDVPSVLLSPVAVDRANILNLLVESGYMTEDQIASK